MSDQNSSQTNGKIVFRIVVCLVILLAGGIGMTLLKNMKKPPAEVAVTERPLRVETLQARTETVQVLITGFGQVQPLDTVAVSAEVSGRVTAVHPRLEKGLVIPKNEVLFRIDPRDYRAALDSAQAEVERLKQSIMLLRRQQELDKQRLVSIERNRDLARADYTRQKKLFTEHDVGSLAFVEKLEQAYNNAKDQAAQMAKLIDLYPLQIKETESALAAAQSRRDNARTNMERCQVMAPFTGRLTEVGVEVGNYVAPGQPVLVIADDSILEIPVSVDSAEARRWLRFTQGKGSGWFSPLEPVTCDIRWTDDDKSLWKGTLHRVTKFDPATRTLTVAVRVNNNQAGSTDGQNLPLVEGMFCRVTIPGRTMENVYRLPRWAVSFKNTVYLATDKGLHTTPVTVTRIQGEEAFVQGLSDGDQVITTRLVEPLENSLIEIVDSGDTINFQKTNSGESQ